MSWAANLADLANAAVDTSAFGEAVLIQGGTEIFAVYDSFGDPTAEIGSEVGLLARISSQPNPLIYAREEDAAGIAEGTTIEVRGEEFVVVRKDVDMPGMVRCELMPAARSAADESSRYR